MIEVTGRNYAMAMLLCTPTHRTYSIYHTVFSSYDDMLCCLGQIRVCYVSERVWELDNNVQKQLHGNNMNMGKLPNL